MIYQDGLETNLLQLFGNREKRVYRSMKGHEERKFQKMSKDNWCCNLSFDNWGITRSNVENIDTKTIYQTSILPIQLVLDKETKDLITLNEWMVRVCLNSNNFMDGNAWNMTGDYSAVNWYRCVSHCSAAKELLLCLFVYQLLSQQSRCVSRCNQIL